MALSERKGNRAEETIIQGAWILILPVNVLGALNKGELVEQGSEGRGESLELLRCQVT